MHPPRASYDIPSRAGHQQQQQHHHHQQQQQQHRHHSMSGSDGGYGGGYGVGYGGGYGGPGGGPGGGQGGGGGRGSVEPWSNIPSSSSATRTAAQETGSGRLGAELRRESIAERLDRGYLDATTLMEHMIKLGVPQRTAHEIIGKLVGVAMQTGVRLADLPKETFLEAHELLDDSVYGVLGVEQAVKAFQSVGSTNPDRVAEQVEAWRERLK